MEIFKRHPKNPLLSPILEHDWEDGAVFNPGATFYNGRFYLFYRAIGDYDHYVSSVGKAVSEDGVNFVRKPEPVIVPKEKYEEFGIEDLRINPLEGKFYLTHTVLGSPAPQGGEPHQVGLIKSDDLETFERIGPITPKEFCSRNAVLFPEQINGHYVMLHRPLYLTREKDPYQSNFPASPGIWISSSENLVDWFNHRLVMEPLFWWENYKIGSGCPPIKTSEGWLIVYHGVDEVEKGYRVYRAGAALLDLEDPAKVLFRLKEPVFEPQEKYEISGDVPNVVFPSGMVEKEGILYLYYGAADTTCCLATASLAELLAQLKKSA